jgi:hypothetical protein
LSSSIWNRRKWSAIFQIDNLRNKWNAVACVLANVMWIKIFMMPLLKTKLVKEFISRIFLTLRPGDALV